MQPVPHPAEVAVRVVRRDDRALRERERRDADRRRHRLVQVQDVELLLGEHARMRPTVRGERTMFGSEPFAGHDDRAADRDDPVGQRRRDGRCADAGAA